MILPVRSNSTARENQVQNNLNAVAVTLADRLEYGFITIDELCQLKQCGRTMVYADIKAGALEIEKHGKSTRVAGPKAKAYVPGAHRRMSGKAA
jgi:hypothetical protein